MAAAHDKWLDQMGSCICKMHEAVAAFAGMSLPYASVHTELSQLTYFHRTLTAVCQKYTPVAANVTASTRSKCAKLVTEFTALLTLLVPQLDRLDCKLSSPEGCSIRPVEEAIFWELWCSLTASCNAFNVAHVQWPYLWSAQESSTYLPTHACFHTLLTWLLRVSRSPAWLAMKSHRGRLSRNTDLLLMLELPTQVFLNLSNAPRQVLDCHLSCLPPTFVPLICCIISEQVGAFLPPVVARPQPAAGVSVMTYTQGVNSASSFCASRDVLLLNMVKLVYNLMKVHSSINSSTLHSLLTSPSTIHALKVILIVYVEQQPQPHNLLDCCVNCLDYCIGLSDQNTEFRLGPPLSVCDRKNNKDAAGLPLHLNPRLSKQALEADVLLLHALSKLMCSNTHCTFICAAQIRIVYNWLISGRQYSLPATALLAMVASAVGLAKQCSLHGLRLMRLAQAGGRIQHKPHFVAPQHAKQSDRQRAPAQLQDKQLAPLDAASLQQFQKLMYLTSEFSMYVPDGVVMSHPGECPNMLICVCVCFVCS